MLGDARTLVSLTVATSNAGCWSDACPNKADGPVKATKLITANGRFILRPFRKEDGYATQFVQELTFKQSLKYTNDVDPFVAIADPTRRRLIELLTEHERPAGELVAHFDVSFSAISQQLRILTEAHLVQSRRDGRKQVYRLNPEYLDPVADWLSRYARAFWKKKLHALGGVLRRMKDEA